MFRIVRKYAREDLEDVFIKEVATRKEAQEHCTDVDTCSATCTTQEGVEHTRQFGEWFDAWYEV